MSIILAFFSLDQYITSLLDFYLIVRLSANAFLQRRRASCQVRVLIPVYRYAAVLMTGYKTRKSQDVH